MADEGTFNQFQADPRPWIQALGGTKITEADVKPKMDDLCWGICWALSFFWLVPLAAQVQPTTAVAYPSFANHHLEFRMRGIEDRTRIRNGLSPSESQSQENL